MRKIKIAIIGATGTAYKRIIPVLYNSSICTIKAIQARDYKKLVRIQQEYSIPDIYTDTTEMLKDTSIDCVYIATPPFLHIENIELAASAEKSIICEKPLCVDFSQCKELKSYPLLFKKENFMIAHHMRHQQAVKEIKDILDNGVLGKIQNVYMQWGFMMNTKTSNYEWKSNPELSGGGALNDVGIHLIDLAQFFWGNPSSVYGVSNNVGDHILNDDETAYLFYDGFNVTIHASQSISNPGNHLLIYGSNGSIEAFNSMGEQSISSFILRIGRDVRTYEYPQENLYKNEIEDFCRDLQYPSLLHHYGTTIDDGIMAMKIIENIHNSRIEH